MAKSSCVLPVILFFEKTKSTCSRILEMMGKKEKAEQKGHHNNNAGERKRTRIEHKWRPHGAQLFKRSGFCFSFVTLGIFSIESG